jgi:hypothetical protein
MLVEVRGRVRVEEGFVAVGGKPSHEIREEVSDLRLLRLGDDGCLEHKQ